MERKDVIAPNPNSFHFCAANGLDARGIGSAMEFDDSDSTQQGDSGTNSTKIVKRELKIVAFFVGVLLSFPFLSYQLPRWSGGKKMDGQVIRTKTGRNQIHFDPSLATTLSWDPRVFIYRKFLSDEECDHLIYLAKGKLEKSEVTDADGTSSASTDRTSSGMFLSNAQDEIIAAIETRISAWTFLPQENGEPMQILRYEIGEKYEPHYDYFLADKDEPGGFRFATVLMYLTDVDKGGETVFPNAQANVSQPKDASWSDCAKTGYAVKPRRGDALLFFSLHPDATPDTNSLHGSCPVVMGEKWSATKWIHESSYVRPKVVDLRRWLVRG